MCCVSIVTILNERHYYGYGRAVYKEVTLNELGQCVLEDKQIGRVFAGCDFRSVLCELY
jgi:hypothetical protein